MVGWGWECGGSHMSHLAYRARPAGCMLLPFTASWAELDHMAWFVGHKPAADWARCMRCRWHDAL